jgi:hypothetical protein
MVKRSANPPSKIDVNVNLSEFTLPRAEGQAVRRDTVKYHGGEGGFIGTTMGAMTGSLSASPAIING